MVSPQWIYVNAHCSFQAQSSFIYSTQEFSYQANTHSSVYEFFVLFTGFFVEAIHVSAADNLVFKNIMHGSNRKPAARYMLFCIRHTTE